ncbi:MAG: GreA/GreB family elongation factor [Phycisphaerales bacterium]
MTEMKVQEIVMKAIAAAQIEPWKYYHVCWWEGKLQITEFDSLRLRTLIASAKSPGSPANALLDKLQRLIESAHTVAPQDIPGDVVTMNSQVRLKDDDKDNEITLSLVFPLDAVKDMEFERMRVSVLSPIGLSILGRRAGDTLEGRIRVERVLYQPEAAGDYHL